MYSFNKLLSNHSKQNCTHVIMQFLKRKFSVELQKTIYSAKAFQSILKYEQYENISSDYFYCSQNIESIREGHLKQSYIYFLIDPRISRNLSSKAKDLKEAKIWKLFLNSIFYVGKAKARRPYSHLYNATEIYHNHLKNGSNNNYSMCKLSRITDIWRNGSGVVSLQAFHNTLPCDAYTREAAIIDAISLPKLTNQRRGIYYGPAKKWSFRSKKLFGIVLLYKAMKILIAEGERQLFLNDIL